MNNAKTAAAVAACLLAGIAAADEPAAEAAPLETQSPLAFRAGGDIRLRQESFDDIPIRAAEPAVTRGGRNDYFRFRTRLAGGIDWEDWLSLDARLCNEFRARNIGQKSYEWPDELIFDQLKLSMRGLFDGRLDLTLGRQDAKLGSGRLFAEGTGKDGSRTQFFDGALARIHLAEKTTLDVFGFYGKCENDLAFGHEHRDMTGLAPGWNGMDEATSGFFFDDRSIDGFGWGFYYVWLHDTAWRDREGEHVPHEDVHTVGARIQPRFSESLSADLEAALQRSGSDGYDRRASFATGSLRHDFAGGAHVAACGLWLSGDDPDTARREDFNILFGRYPWISELMLYAFDGDGVGTWRNLSSAWIEAGYDWGEGRAHKVTATAGPVFAPERDGAGGGDERGWLETLSYVFPLVSGRAGDLKGHLLLNVFEPGDYYASSKTAWFARWQLNWVF